MPTTTLRIGLAVAALTLAAPAGFAQQTRDAGADGRLQAMVSQLTAERASLLADKQRLTRELDAAKAELEALQGQYDEASGELLATSRSLVRNQAEQEQTSRQLERTEERLETLIGEFRETIDLLGETETERNEYRVRFETRDREYRACVKSNNEMYATSSEILDAYDRHGLFSRAMKAEPFLKLKRNQIENLIDDYRYELEDQLLEADLASD